MKQKYVNWIIDYQVKHNIVAGLCFSACSLMFKNFSELEIKRGFIVDGWGKLHTHWYCFDNDSNEIIDPTISQFDHLLVAGPLKYEEYNESIHGPLSTGKCMDCSKLLYNNEKFCNNICSENTLKYLNRSEWSF
jgi:hypothetical protein